LTASARPGLGHGSSRRRRLETLQGPHRRIPASGEAKNLVCPGALLRTALVAAVGEEIVVRAERSVTIACIDRAWRDHLALCANLREGVHLVRLGGQDPLTRFTREAIEAYQTIDERIDEAVLEALETVRVADGTLDLAETGLRAPVATAVPACRSTPCPLILVLSF
jgi:hypothetical protein